MSLSAHSSARSLVVFALALSAVACDTTAERDPYTPNTSQATPSPTVTSCTPGAKRHCGPSTCGGVLTCSEDGTWPGAEACEQPAETCDGADNDCDGVVDETFTDLNSACNYDQDSCTGPGVKMCAEDGSGTVCMPAQALRNTPERCDGSDDDCDGRIDEDFNVGSSCNAGVGACNETGAYVCNEAGNGTTCDAVPSEPRDETCNYADDDCDGSTDEGFLVGQVCSDGEGACRQEAVYECSGSGRGVTCSAQASAPSAERCDGLDNDCDGETDESFDEGEPTLHSSSTQRFSRSSAVSYTYNEAGELLSEDHTFANEPTRAQSHAYTRDAEGLVTRLEVSDNGVNATTPFLVMLYTYDALEPTQLNLVTIENDTEGREVRYTYGAEGQLEQVTYVATLPVELELGFALYSYDALGRVSEVLRSGPSSPLDELEAGAERCELNTYNDSDMIETLELDLGCDGEIDETSVYSYSAEGQLLSVSSELNTSAYQYSAEGWLELVTLNGGDAGELTMSVREHITAEGQPLYEEHDEDGDGAFDVSYTYMYDEAGTLTMIGYDSDLDGVIDFDMHLTYNEAGQHITTESTGAGLTEPALDRWSYSYDEAGWLIEETYDANADDTVDHIITYSYDEAGRLSTVELVEGESEVTTSYVYEGDATLASGATFTGDSEASEASFSYEGDQLMSAEYTQGALLVSRESHTLGCWVE